MIRDDWLLRQFQDLAAGLAGVKSAVQEQVELLAASDELERLARGLGLSLASIDRLPAAALSAALGTENGPRALAELLIVAADLADALGEPELARARREKAAALNR